MGAGERLQEMLSSNGLSSTRVSVMNRIVFREGEGMEIWRGLGYLCSRNRIEEP